MGQNNMLGLSRLLQHTIQKSLPQYFGANLWGYVTKHDIATHKTKLSNIGSKFSCKKLSHNEKWQHKNNIFEEITMKL